MAFCHRYQEMAIRSSHWPHEESLELNGDMVGMEECASRPGVVRPFTACVYPTFPTSSVQITIVHYDCPIECRLMQCDSKGPRIAGLPLEHHDLDKPAPAGWFVPKAFGDRLLACTSPPPAMSARTRISFGLVC